MDKVNIMTLNGAQKSAYLLMHLNINTSTKVLDCLEKKEIEIITQTMLKVQKINEKKLIDIIKEYFNIYNKNYALKNTINKKSLNTLEQMIGKVNANELLKKLDSKNNISIDKKPDKLLVKYFSKTLEKEPSKIVGIILSYLSTNLSVNILQNIRNKEKKSKIILNIAQCKQLSSMSEIELNKLVHTILKNENITLNYRGGIKKVEKILSFFSNEEECSILKYIYKKNSVLANQIKSNIPVLKTIQKITIEQIQQLIKITSIEELAIAFYNSHLPIKNQIFKTLSEKQKQEIQNFYKKNSSITYFDIKEKQKKILKTIKKLNNYKKI